MEQVKTILSQMPLFQSLDENDLQFLSSRLESIEASPGQVLFLEGDVGDHFYVILFGQVEVVKDLGTPDERSLGLRGPGDSLGEMSLLSPEGLRTASVRAVCPVQLVMMTRAVFEELLRRQPKMAYEMARVLNMRMMASEKDSIRDLKEKNRQLRQAYEQLKAAQAELIEKEKLEHELQVARDIQMSVLPEGFPELEGFDFGALLVSARAVGGDLYNFILLDEDHVGIAVGDVTDKGVPAAIFMAQTNALLHSEARRGVPPRESLLRVNNHLLGMNSQGLFVTVLYGVLDRVTREFSYARAGHELPILFLPCGEVFPPIPMKTGQPLGILENPQIDQGTLTISAGSILLLYTDGAKDMTSPEGESFGMQRLMEALRADCGKSAQEICDCLFKALKDFQQSATQFDDITLLVVRGIN